MSQNWSQNHIASEKPSNFWVTHILEIKNDSLVANTFLKQIILMYKLQTLMILRLFKISTLLVFLMSQNQSQNFTSQNS